MGPLNCAVRFEVDAYSNISGQPPSDEAQDEGAEDTDDVTTTLTQVKISSPEKKRPASDGEGLTRVIHRGPTRSYSHLVEIKTSRHLDIDQALPQLWFGHVTLLLHGAHNYGQFERITYNEMEPRFKKWEEDNQVALRKMVSLIIKFRELVLEHGPCVVVCDAMVKPLQLDVYKSTSGKGVLPQELVERYWPKAAET